MKLIQEVVWSRITALVLALLVAYALSMYLGLVAANFSLLLFTAVVISGIYWLLEKKFWRPRAHRWWLEWTAGLFPVLLFVFILRSFIVEPFRIPSASMTPTLHVGDLILVNKFHYGIRLPIIGTLVVKNKAVERGDVMVFRYPPEPNVDYIKRVVGLPGDEVVYLNKELWINGKKINRQAIDDFYDKQSQRYVQQFSEHLSSDGHQTHGILIEASQSPFISGIIPFEFQDHCQYNQKGVICKVPEGHYFMMGDNRDNSLDSRFWGFVPDSHIVGKAFFVWMNFGDWNRIGRFN